MLSTLRSHSSRRTRPDIHPLALQVAILAHCQAQKLSLCLAGRRHSRAGTPFIRDVEPLLMSFIERAATRKDGQAVAGTSFRSSFSPAVFDYLREATGLDVPSPAFHSVR